MRQLLKDIAEIAAGQGAPQGEANYCNDGTPFVKAGNLVDLIGGMPIDSIQKVSETVAKEHRLRLFPKGTVLFAKSGMSCTKGYVYVLPCDAYVVSHLACIISFTGDMPSFLQYYFRYHKPYQLIKDDSYPSISLADIGNLTIETLDHDTRQRIVVELDRISHIIEARKRELSTLDTLIKARFVEMFGDMLINPMHWPEQRLESVAEIVSGITKGRKIQTTELYDVPYMAVSNVKDGYIDWTTVKSIAASKAEIEQYRLLPDDVLMTEGGDPDKLGRGAIIRNPPRNCIHQNHIFRVRLNHENVLPEFMEQYLQHQRAKRYFLGCAKQTTGIASINMTQLRALPMLMPPLGIQKQFAAFVSQVDKSKVVVQAALDRAQMLFDSLMQQYFG